MIARELRPGSWHVNAETEEEVATLRWLLLKLSKPLEAKPAPRWYDDFHQMRESAALHWELQVEAGSEGAVFEPFEDVAQRLVGLRCRRTGAEWTLTVMALRNDSSKWRQMMTTSARRSLFATHPNFGKWARMPNPFDPCDGFRVNPETSSLDPA